MFKITHDSNIGRLLGNHPIISVCVLPAKYDFSIVVVFVQRSFPIFLPYSHIFNYRSLCLSAWNVAFLL